MTFAALNRFCSLSDYPTHPHSPPLPPIALFLADNITITLDEIPSLALYFISSLEKILLWKVLRYSYTQGSFICCFTSVFISADIIFYTFRTWFNIKKDFHHKFSFLMWESVLLDCSIGLSKFAIKRDILLITVVSSFPLHSLWFCQEANFMTHNVCW